MAEYGPYELPDFAPGERDQLLARMQAVTAAEPDLCANGFRHVDGRKTFAADRARMLTDEYLKEFRTAFPFLRAIGKTKTVNRRSSYGLKHNCENWTGFYIANGVFIAAAISEGFTAYRREYHGPNCAFNMSKRDLNDLMKQAEESEKVRK
jgi:hypothetical protein